MEYAEIIRELTELLDRIYDEGGYDVTVFNSEEKAIAQAIEALYKLINLES